MDYENARMVIERLKTCLEHESCEKVDCEYFNTFEDLKGLLEWLETEHAPIVRCKDCRFHRKGRNEVDSWNTCLLWKAEIYDEFFCASGEKPDGKPWNGM